MLYTLFGPSFEPTSIMECHWWVSLSLVMCSLDSRLPCNVGTPLQAVQFVDPPVLGFGGFFSQLQWDCNIYVSTLDGCGPKSGDLFWGPQILRACVQYIVLVDSFFGGRSNFEPKLMWLCQRFYAGKWSTFLSAGGWFIWNSFLESFLEYLYIELFRCCVQILLFIWFYFHPYSRKICNLTFQIGWHHQL